MEQRGNAHFFHVDVVPPDCPVLRVVGGPLGATNDLQYTQQGWRTGILQLIFDGEEFRKMAEKRHDAGHHHGTGNGRDVMLQGTPADWLSEGQHADGHDRVLQDQVSQFARVDTVKVGAHFFDSALGDAQDRQAVVGEKQCPGIYIRQGVVEHGVRAFEK